MSWQSCTVTAQHNTSQYSHSVSVTVSVGRTEVVSGQQQSVQSGNGTANLWCQGTALSGNRYLYTGSYVVASPSLCGSLGPPETLLS